MKKDLHFHQISNSVWFGSNTESSVFSISVFYLLRIYWDLEVVCKIFINVHYKEICMSMIKISNSCLPPPTYYTS